MSNLDSTANFLLSEELIEFRAILRKFFSEKVKTDHLKRAVHGQKSVTAEPDYLGHAQIWEQLVELGVLSAPVPEELDGLGFGTQALAVVLEESARVLLQAPLLEVLGYSVATLLLLGGEKVKQELLSEVVLGKLIVGASFSELFSGEAENGSELTAIEHDDGQFVLSGKCRLVSSVRALDSLILRATLRSKGKKKGELALFHLRVRDNKNLKVFFAPTFDLLRPYYDLEIVEAKADLISKPHITDAEWGLLKGHLLLCHSAEMLGALGHVLELTVDYVKTRNQFGQPIGSFQTIQHMLADVYLQEQEIMALVRYCSWACANETPENFQQAAFAAFAATAEGVPQLIERCLQLHGGIGFTFEYELHLYLRRVQVLSRLAGGIEEIYEELGQRALQA